MDGKRLIRLGLLPVLIIGLFLCASTLALLLEAHLSGSPAGVLAQERTRRRVPTRPAPTRAVPTATPTAVPAQPTATPVSALSEVRIGNSSLRTVIGDRLSPVIYALTANGDLFRSSDSGITWNLMARETEADDFVVSPADPMVLYRGSGLLCDEADAVTQPFYRSDDGGVTWTRLPLGDNLIPLLAHPQDAGALLAADCDMPYLTRDRGESWQPKPDLSPSELWESFRAKEIVAASQVGGLPADSANWHYLYAAGVDADGASMVAYSGDIGDNWERITPRINPEPIGLSALVADPYTAGRLWFADEHGVWYTEDFGISWQLTSSGLEDVLEEDAGIGVTALAVGADDAVYVGTVNGGLYKGDGFGGEWAPVDDEALQNLAVEDLLPQGRSGILWINASDGVYRYKIP